MRCFAVLAARRTPAGARGPAIEGAIEWALALGLAVAAVTGCSRTTLDGEGESSGGGATGGGGGGGECLSGEQVCCGDKTGTLLGAERFGDDESQSGWSIDVDGTGHVWLAGLSEGMIDLGGGPLGPPGPADLFLARFDPSGQPLWSTAFGGGALEPSIAATADGGVILAGTAAESMDFGFGTTPPDELWGDIFLVRFDELGNPLWSRVFGAEDDEWMLGMAVDPAGPITIIGRTLSDAVDLGGGPLGNTDFVASFDAEGQYRWHRQLDEAWPGSVAVAGATGDVVVTGWRQADEWNEIPEGPWVRRLDRDGETLWERSFPETSYFTMIRAAAVGPDGEVVLVCPCAGVDFGEGASATTGTLTVVKLSAGGEVAWARSFLGPTAESVAVDGCGDVVLTGTYSGEVDFGDGGLPAAEVPSLFVAKLGADGQALWSRAGLANSPQASPLEINSGTDVVASPDGQVWVTGYFSRSLELAGQPLSAAGEGGAQHASDALLARLAR